MNELPIPNLLPNPSFDCGAEGKKNDLVLRANRGLRSALKSLDSINGRGASHGRSLEPCSSTSTQAQNGAAEAEEKNCISIPIEDLNTGETRNIPVIILPSNPLLEISNAQH